MREILFRGKRIDNGEWVFGSYAFEPRRKGAFGQIISDLDHERHYIVSKKNYEYWEIIPETVGQFTGTYDRNGKKIFEGDIIAFRSSESIYEVAYDITDSKFIILLRNGKDSFLRFYNISAYYFSVIANKWDNPELLEEEE